MKKNKVNNNEKYIVGIGSCNIDIYGSSKIKIRTHYDHPAIINSNVGGVMYNIISNYVKLNAKAKLITAYANDGFGLNIVEHLKKEKIDIEDSLLVKDKSTGIFMQIQDENNDMYLALCDMSTLESITPEYIQKKKKVISNASLVVLDPSLRNDTIEEIIKICKDKTDICVDPISDNYAKKIKPYIKYFRLIKPNKSELEVLSGMKIDNTNIEKACKKLIKKGLKSILVSLGKDGVIYMDKDITIRKKLKEEKNPVNMSGAGDALMATFVYGIVNDISLDKTIDYALAAGIGAIRSNQTINKDMSLSLLNKILKENKK